MPQCNPFIGTISNIVRPRLRMTRALSFALAWVVSGSAAAWGGELFDDFEGDQLDESIWWAKAWAGGSATLTNGELVLSTQKEEDRIFLLYREAIPPGEAITAELRINVQENEHDGWFGFLRDWQQGDDGLNALKDATMFFVNFGSDSVQPRGEDGQREDPVSIEVNQFHTFKIEVTADEYRMSIDDQEVHRGERNDSQYTNRVFYITPDGFACCYGPATYRVDWIRLSGPSIPQYATAVAAKSWGEVKEQAALAD